jgi:hypothetical protein
MTEIQFESAMTKKRKTVDAYNQTALLPSLSLSASMCLFYFFKLIL